MNQVTTNETVAAVDSEDEKTIGLEIHVSGLVFFLLADGIPNVDNGLYALLVDPARMPHIPHDPDHDHTHVPHLPRLFVDKRHKPEGTKGSDDRDYVGFALDEVRVKKWPTRPDPDSRTALPKPIANLNDEGWKFNPDKFAISGCVTAIIPLPFSTAIAEVPDHEFKYVDEHGN